MKVGLYKGLTLEDKINLLYYERGRSALCQIQHFEDLSSNPETEPRCNQLYISNVLDLDWEEFYNDKQSSRKGKAAFDAVKKAAISISSKKDIRSGHIIDALNDVLYFYTHPDEKYSINEGLVDTIDKDIKRIYKVFSEFNVEYELIPNMQVDMQPIYRRVEK